MGESRAELLAWVNMLLQTSYTRIEQLGTGAAYAQVFDSIWGDVEMSKIKFESRQEYEYIQNFKVLQRAFGAHKVEKLIPVERLTKCKFQENIEFCQWVKKYHDNYYIGGYDPNARRRGPNTASGGSHTHKLNMQPSPAPGAEPIHSRGRARTPAKFADHSVAVATVSGSNQSMDDVYTQLEVCDTDRKSLFREREFYFDKLRQIEILVQKEEQMLLLMASQDSAAAGIRTNGKPSDLLVEIKKILYSTEDGFIVPGAKQDFGETVSEDQERDYDDEDDEMEAL